MANPELVQALDYILNRSDELSIEVLAEAVVRRRRELAMFGSAVKVPDPRRLAKEMTEQINAGTGSSIDSLKNSIREMAIRIIREQAPELNERQIEELSRAWIPDIDGQSRKPSQNMMISMIEQFISFSQGTMDKRVEKGLRDELGAWPERYWNIFPPAIRQVITDFLKNRITEEEYYSKVRMALEIIQ